MKKMICMSALCLAAFSPALRAIPSAINYQGTLKEKGLPANGSKNMLFRITNQDGSLVYWSSTQVSVPVNNGLFSTQISPTGVPWETIAPYIEVSVEGQLLLPRESVNATVYATVSNSVVDNAITTSKLANGAVTSEKLDLSVQNSIAATGVVVAYAGGIPPPGWLNCDGSPVSRSTYGNLFSAIGFTWGAGDGVTTFNLPDLRGRTPIGAGQGANLSNRTSGQYLGEENHTLTTLEMPTHSHSITDLGHTHTESPHTHGLIAPGSLGVVAIQNGGPDQGYSGGGSPGGGSWAITATQPSNGAGTGSSTTGITVNMTGGSGPHNIMQPSMVINYIIKT